MADFRSWTQNQPTGWDLDYQGNNDVFNKQTGQTVSADTIRQITGADSGAGYGSPYGGNPTYGMGDKFLHNNFDLLANNQAALARGDYSKYQEDVFNRQYLLNPLTAQNDPSKQYYQGDPRFALNQANMLQAQSAAAMGRNAPTIDTSGMQPWQLGAQASLGNMNQAVNNVNANGAMLNAQGYALNRAATGAGYQGQIGAAQGLQALSQMPAGPSVAEQAMRMQSAQNERTQAALAASARGGNSALALNNAAANAATVGGNLQQQLGIQRAQEDMANRQFSANALGAAGNMYGNAAGTQLGAYGGAVNAFGNAAGAFNQAGGLSANQGQLNLQGAQQMGNIATQNAANQLGQTQLNQQYGLGSQQLANQYLTSQLNASSQAEANRTQNATNLVAGQYANRDRTGEGTITGSGGGDKLLGGLTTAGGIALGTLSDVRAKKDVKPASADVSNAFRVMGGMTEPTAPTQEVDTSYGGPASNAAQVRKNLMLNSPGANGIYGKEAIWPSSGGNDINLPPTMGNIGDTSYYAPTPLTPNVPFTGMQPTMGNAGDQSYYANPLTSDIRAKKDIHPAQAAIDEAYRQGALLRNTDVQYPMSVGRMPDVNAPAYSYEYKHPNSPGAAPGVHYGPMAQDLEQTPAGRSVVVTKPNGMKGIDTSRLSLLNTSELAKQRAELDALKASVPAAIMAPQVQYPQPSPYMMGMR